MKTLLRLCALLSLCASFAFARVNVNQATQAELEALPDVGPVKAKAIVDYRKQNGPFKSLEDLEKVRGIGPATVKALKNEVSFTGAPNASPKAAEKPNPAPTPSLDAQKKAPSVKPAPAAPAVPQKAAPKPLPAPKRP